MKTLPELATNLMKEWYEAHCDKPYPTESERQELARLGQITESQVTVYIINKTYFNFSLDYLINYRLKLGLQTNAIVHLILVQKLIATTNLSSCLNKTVFSIKEI